MSRSYRYVAVALVTATLVNGLVACASKPPATPPVATPEPPSAVTAKATIQPRQQAHLSFRVLGQVVALPRVGDAVTEGQELARLDTSDLDLAIAQAQDALAVSQATLAQAQSAARPEELAALQAAVDAALGKQNQLAAGPAQSGLDAAKVGVASADDGLKAAKARLAQVQSGATAADVAAAEAAVGQARATLAAAQQRRATLDPASPSHQAAVRQGQLAVEAAKN